MGHFSHTCQLSHLPITRNTEVLLFPLKMRDNLYEYSEERLRKIGSTFMCAEQNTSSRFIPFGFPIRGVYDDYGRIEDIQEDENTRFLEDYFNLSIQDIANVICSGRKADGFDDDLAPIKVDGKKRGIDYKEGYEELLSLSGMWLHAGFYDDLIQNFEPDEYDNVGMGNDMLLKTIGFQYVGEDRDKERFTKKYQLGDCTLYSDGYYIEQSIFTLEDLAEFLKLEDIEFDFSGLQKKSFAQQVYDYILPKVRHELMNPPEDPVEVMMFRMGDEHKAVHHIFDKTSYGYTSRMAERYLKLCEDGKFRKHVHELYIIDDAFYSCGKRYDITGVSPQDGDHKTVLSVLTSAVKALEKDMDKLYD